MRIPLLHADFEHGAYTKVAKALRKVWPFDPLTLMQSQDALGVLLGYSSHFEARREAVEAFPTPAGSIGMKEVANAVVKRMFVKYGIDPISGRALVGQLHLKELAIAGASRESEVLRMFREAMEKGQRDLSTDNPAVAHMFLDEAWSMWQSDSSPLKERLRRLEGIPNATYQVRGTRVFVFEKLVRHVEALGIRENDPDLPEIARLLIDEASTDPLDAVSQWKIVPAPYAIEEIEAGHIGIFHRPFNAWIPGIYRSSEETQAPLTTLLMGGVVEGRGDFEYKGQQLTLREPLDLDRFTAVPPVIDPRDPRVTGFGAPMLNGWLPGFAPVSQSHFRRVYDTAFQWESACASMHAAAERDVELVWPRVRELQLEALNDASDVVPEDEHEEAAGLRRCYPQLGMLTDASLWSLYDAYQSDRWSARSWEPVADAEFIFYLAGRRLGQKVPPYELVSLGKFALFWWSRAGSLEEGCAFAQRVYFNSTLAAGIKRRVADAMRFLKQESQAIDLRGPEITVFTDVLRFGRKRNLLFVTQDQAVIDPLRGK